MNRLSQLRQEKGLNMREAARGLNMPYTTYVNYEKGTREPNSETLIALAEFYGVSIDYLLCKSSTPNSGEIPPGFQPMPAMTEVPLVGRIACGTPITAEENVERMVCVPSKWHATFTLTCEGISMEPKIHDGDLVAIRSQPTVENGEVAAVRIEGEATLKRVYLHSNFIELRAENPAFESIILAREEMNTVTIEGKAVGLCRDI